MPLLGSMLALSHLAPESPSPESGECKALSTNGAPLLALLVGTPLEGVCIGASGTG